VARNQSGKPSMFSAIYAAVESIPRGKVSTYGAVARAAGHPGAARQVVWALHTCHGRLPWHRVVGANGRILLRGEAGLEQRLRLQAEGVAFSGGVVVMEGHEFQFRSRRAPGKG
jgi:methylated-DNA-protein-cysteine methyltransferase related protein